MLKPSHRLFLALIFTILAGTNLASMALNCSQRNYVVKPPNATTDKSLIQFQQRLLRTVKTRDTQELLKLVHPDVQLDNGGGKGKVEFIQDWGLDQKPKQSPVWTYLNSVLSIGGGYTAISRGRPETTSFFMPYTSQLCDDLTEQEVPYLFVTAPSAKIYSKPAVSSPALLNNIGYHVVQTAGLDEKNAHAYVDIYDRSKNKWILVKTYSQKPIKGYIQSKYLVSPSDQKLELTKDKQGWLITGYYTGL